MAEKSAQPVVIKKVVKGGGHHGGSWKVAYADFVTAMMAFFLLMWLLATANQQQKAAISEYFKNPSAEIGASPTPSPGAVQGPSGTSTSVIDMGGGAPLAAEQSAVSDSVEKSTDETAPESTEQQAEKRFRDRIAEMLEELRELAARNEILKQYQDQLLFDITTEGLRIQVLDKDNRPMFDVGSAALKPHTHEILREIAKVINEIPSPVSITGYTDGRPLDRAGYSNWELSTERANAARRASRRAACRRPRWRASSGSRRRSCSTGPTHWTRRTVASASRCCRRSTRRRSRTRARRYRPRRPAGTATPPPSRGPDED